MPVSSKKDPMIYELLADDRFDVRADGTVWSCATKWGRKDEWRRVGSVNDKGYEEVVWRVRENGTYPRLRTARIVYAKFNGPLDSNLEVDHINKIRNDNRPENLRLFNHRQNTERNRKAPKERSRKAQTSLQKTLSINTILEDPLVDVRIDGTMWRQYKGTGEWREVGKSVMKRGDGYYVLKYKDETIYVHRVIFAKFCGDLKEGLVIDHIDGNTFNNKPENLMQVSLAANKRKGKRVSLSQEKALEIREAYDRGEFQLDIANRFDISSTHVSQIVNNRLWRPEEITINP